MRKFFTLFFALIAITLIIFLKFSDFRFDISEINKQNPLIIFSIITIAGLIDSINPCAISVLFISLSFIIGLGYQRKKILALGIFYILGVYISYILIGIGIFKTFGVIGIPTILILKIFAVILILFAANEIIKNQKPEFSLKLEIPKFIKPLLAKLTQRASYLSIFFLGALVGVFEFPCTGGPYLFVLSLLQAETTFSIGLLYLLYYNFLFVFPLLTILFFIYKIQDLKKIQEKSRIARQYGKYITPIILIILGISILLFYK